QDRDGGADAGSAGQCKRCVPASEAGEGLLFSAAKARILGKSELRANNGKRNRDIRESESTEVRIRRVRRKRELVKGRRSRGQGTGRGTDGLPGIAQR